MTHDPRPSFPALVRAFARIGCISFGGPAGQIALMHRELVEDRRWISESQYLHALNFCHLLPGPEAQQLAIWIGWRLHGLRGGLAAGLLFVLPGAAIILALSVLYGYAAHLSWFAALFLGIKAAVLAIIVQALLRLGGRTLNTPFKKLVAVIAFLLLALFNAPFPLVVLGAGAIGTALARWRPQWLALSTARTQAFSSPRPWMASLRAVVTGGMLWAAPLAVILLTLGPDHILWQIGSFFSRLAVVSFGGAYAVLTYMAQEAVQNLHWLHPGEMADGLGLAETTPGPLILVTQFVGYLAAFRAPEPFSPLVAGVLGAILTLWVTFAPCFLWVFALAPWIERFELARLLKGALTTITAAIVGVIANLSLWFALHVLFTRADRMEVGAAHVMLPDLASVDWRAAVLALLSAFLLFRRRWTALKTLGAAAIGGLVLGQLA